MPNTLRKLLLLALLWGTVHSLAFSQEKTIVNNAQFWTSYNAVFRLTPRLGLLNDFHVRRTNFVVDPSFYFLRVGARYWFEPKVNVSGGYAHLWLAPQREDWSTFSNENRIYQEIQMAGIFNRSSVLFRIRNEQRWREQIVDDQSTGDFVFSNRIRMLLSASLPLGENARSVRLMVANEIHFNLGRAIVFNTFDQNRFTVGINQRINANWRYDLGYMIVYQQLADGFTYNLNHTLRLFFYGLFDFSGKRPVRDPRIIEYAEE